MVHTQLLTAFPVLFVAVPRGFCAGLYTELPLWVGYGQSS